LSADIPAGELSALRAKIKQDAELSNEELTVRGSVFVELVWCQTLGGGEMD
jgi:hypothetical protein